MYQKANKNAAVRGPLFPNSLVPDKLLCTDVNGWYNSNLIQKIINHLKRASSSESFTSLCG
jgi:hypothetical protein